MALLPFLKRGKKSINTTYYTMTPDIVGSFATGSRVDCKNVKGQMNAYVNCPPVATLIGAKATAANNAVWWFGKEDGTETLNGSTKLLKDLFERPNEYQDWDRFFSLAYMMNQLFGKAYIYVIQPVGLARRYATSMLVIPNTYVTPIYYGNQTGVYYYNVVMGGQSFKIDPEDMMVWNDFTFDISQTMNYMDGQSRLFSLSDPVNNIIAAYEANNTLLTNFGMMGIVSPDPANNIEGLVVPMEDDKKKQVQDDLQKKYGIMRNQWPFLLTGQPVKYTAVGRPTKDLMLIETIKDSVQVLSQAYRYPFSLLGYDSTLTYDNVRISERMLYSNAIMPELKGFISVFNRYFGNTSDNQLRFSFDHIASMQESKTETEQALKNAADRLRIEVEAGLTTLEDAKIELQNLKS